MLFAQPEQGLPKIELCYDAKASRVTYEMGDPVGGLMVLFGAGLMPDGRTCFAQANLTVTRTGDKERRELIYGIVEPLFGNDAAQVITEVWRLTEKKGWHKTQHMDSEYKGQLTSEFFENTI